jgi:hypothetical protein
VPSQQRGTGLTLIEKIYTDYDEYLQDAYEEQIDKYTQQHERAQESTRQQGEE